MTTGSARTAENSEPGVLVSEPTPFWSTTRKGVPAGKVIFADCWLSRFPFAKSDASRSAGFAVVQAVSANISARKIAPKLRFIVTSLLQLRLRNSGCFEG
jgi:hypothetical protein